MIRALGILALLGAGASAIAAIWLDPWWSWLLTTVALVLIGAGFSTWADAVEHQNLRRRMLDWSTCGHRSEKNDAWVCILDDHHAGPHHYLEAPE